MMKYLNIAGYIAIPLAYVIHLWIGKGQSWEPVVTFILAALGVVPLAHVMGEATEHLAERTGPTWGGLLNATFGNAAELIIAIIALTKGLNEIVKASLTGSILGNLLLVGGGAMVAGGWRRERQVFSRSAAEANGGLLTIAIAALLMPAIFHYVASGAADPDLSAHDHHVSVATSVILLLVYAAGLLFTLRTHAHLLTRAPRIVDEAEGPSDPHEEQWSVKKSVLLLLAASAGIAVVAELLVGSTEQVAARFGWNEIFVGVIVLAIVGNAAEHSTAVLMALRDDMDTAMTITYQSSVQIALFATPLLVLVSMIITSTGHFPMSHHLNLLFSPLEVAAVMLSVLTVVVLGLNGETNWFEGVLLLGLYAILSIAFYYIPVQAIHATIPVHTP
jgi:Ca2+:H+ antiporter